MSMIPINELWMHEPSVKESLSKAIEWSVKNSPKEYKLTDLKEKTFMVENAKYIQPDHDATYGKK